MSCVNIKSPDYKALIQGMSRKQEFVARVLITKFMTENNDKLPNFVELKSLVADLYNTPQGGIDYSSFYQEARNMFKTLVPSMSNAELDQRVKFVDQLELMRLRSGKKVLTSFINGVVYISNSLLEERGDKAYTDIRHEIFHVIFNNFLNDKEQEAMVETFKRWKPEHSAVSDKVALEELMADAYEDYSSSAKKTIPTMIKNFFEKVFKFLGLLSKNYVDIQKLFDDVNNGKFTRNQIKDSLVTRDKTIIDKHSEFFTNPDLFLRAKSFVLNNLNDLMFPSENDKLSEITNSNLFINKSVNDILFQNNKDLFKLGLTKEEALKQLEKRIEVLKTFNSQDPQQTEVINVLTSKRGEVLKDLFNYLQPYSEAVIGKNGELTLRNAVATDPTEALLEADEETNNLEIGSKELINPVTKISEVVKDFLSSVTYRISDNAVASIDPGAGFIALLNLLGNLYGNISLADNKISMSRSYANTAKGNQTKAVYERLLKLHNNVDNYNRINLNVKGVPQSEIDTLTKTLDSYGIKTDVFKGNMTVSLPSNLKIENRGTNNVDNRVTFSFNRFNEKGQSFLITQGREDGKLFNETNKAFIERVSDKTGIPNFIINRLFTYNEERNQIAELTKVAGSLRKIVPKFVRVSTTKVTADETFIVTKYHFLDAVNELRDSISLAATLRERMDIIEFRKDVLKSIDTYKAVRERGDVTKMRALLHDIIVDKLSIISESDFSKISDNKDVSLLLNGLERIANYSEEIRTDKTSEEFKDAPKYLTQTSTFANLLQKYTNEKNNPTSFTTSTSGKQKWENQMANSGYKTFKNLQGYALGLFKMDKLLPALQDGFNTYFRYNPIFRYNGTSSMAVNENMFKYRDADFHADPQETYFDNRISGYVKPPIPFSKESPRDWINRNFLAMFNVPILEASATSGQTLSYFQQKFQPESAPNVSAVKMGVATAQQLQHNIMSMFIQEAYMHHVYQNSDKKALKNNTKKSYIPGIEGRSYFIGEKGNIFFSKDGRLNDGSKEMNDGIARPEYNFGREENGELKINRNNPLLKELFGAVMDNLDASMEKFVETAIEEKATLEGIQLSDVYSKIHEAYMDKYKISLEELSVLRGISISGKTNLEELKASKNFEEQKRVLKKAMSAYFLNSFANGFFMNQISSGATQNYKNPMDEVKRQAGVNAMHDTGLIDNKHGMPNQYNNTVIEGANNFYGASNVLTKFPLLKRFFMNKKQEVGDAQTWDLPEYKRMVRKSFGKSVDIGVITKDVHYEINKKAAVDYRKTSSAELTNELVRDNKTLRNLRYELTFGRYLKSLGEKEKAEAKDRIDYLYNKMIDNANKKNNFDGLEDNIDEYMEYQNLLDKMHDEGFMVHKASFDSAIKGAKPTVMSKFTKDKETGTFNFKLEEGSILPLNSAYTGIQQAVRHKYIDSFISHFTQLTYLIGLNRTETSIKNNKIITRTLSQFTKAGIFDSLFDYRMAYDSEDKLLKVNSRSRLEVIKDLKKKLDLPGNENLMSLLNTPGISMNNPIFTEKLMQTLFNTLTKKTVAPKHPGGSFVLQSEFGFEANKILQKHSLRTPEFRPDLGYAECYLPEMYSDQIKAGEMIYYNSPHYNKMFGFRIPSSDLHSSVPLKIIGYYPSSAHDNVVVIPSAVTALHGSDFDVDKLFVVRHGVFGVKEGENDPTTDLDTEEHEYNEQREYKTRFQEKNVTIAQKGIKFGQTAPNAVYDQKGNIKSFGDGEVHNDIANLHDVLLDEKEKTMNEILKTEIAAAERENEATDVKAVISRRKTERNRDEAKIKDLREHLKTLRNIQKGLYSNQVLNSVLDNIDYRGENAEDIFTGISFDPVKGYEEDSQYSKLAQVYSDINKAKGSTDLLAQRPTMYTSVDAARSHNRDMVEEIEDELENGLGVNLDTPEGQQDLLSLINDQLKDNWVKDRDAFIGRSRGSSNLNINKVNDHMTVHKETYMAAGLVGLIANFSKGLAYAFHGLMDKGGLIQLGIAEKDRIVIDGQTFNTLSLVNKDGVKTQELRSLSLNAAIDHVKEQILNVLNVGNKTAKIFLAAISTEMSMHQATMIMLQPVAKELNGSNATKVDATLKLMKEQITQALKQQGVDVTETMINELKVSTADMEKHITNNFREMLSNTTAPNYKENLLLQYKIANQLGVMEAIGQEVSNVSSALSVIQGLPYNLETAYDKLKSLNNFINVAKFYGKLTYTEKSEYGADGFKDDLRSTKNILSNVNLANNENVLAALEAIKTQIDMTSELFTENSIQAQYFIGKLLKAISTSSDPSTLLTGDNDVQIDADTTKNMGITEKYLKGKNSYNLIKMISRNIFNFFSSGLYMNYNTAGHLMTFNIKGQELATITGSQGTEFQLNAVRSYVNSFLMKEGDAYENNKVGSRNVKSYKGNDYVVSQINPEWRLKPLSIIKKQNVDNKFLSGLGIDISYKNNIRVMTFNSSMINNAENLAEVKQAIDQLNNLSNIYVKFNEKSGMWEDLPREEHPLTDEMNEIVFNILKSSLYVDKFKFGTTKITSIIPPAYYVKVFKSLDTLMRDLMYYQKNEEGNKYFKDFKDLNDKTSKFSAIGDMKENLFINTIFSIPNVLPNLKSVLPSNKDRKHLIKQAGMLADGSIYDLYFDSKILDSKNKDVEPEQAETTSQMTDSMADPNDTDANPDVTDSISEQEAEADLHETLRKNPSFIVDEDFKKPGNYQIFMKVGSTGTKESGDQKHYYKRIGFVAGSLTNNSFDMNQLVNKYKIEDHFNPKKLAIPVKGEDLSKNRITLNNVRISSFMINASDNERTSNAQNTTVKEAFEQQYQLLRNLPENRQKTDDTIRAEIRTKVNVENVINRVNEVSLYDSRNLDRLGIKNFKVVSSTISADRSTVSFVLDALPAQRQIAYNTTDSPIVMLSTLTDNLSRDEKIAKVNSTPGLKSITSGNTLTDAEVDLQYRTALELDESKEVNKVLQDKIKNCE